MLNYDEWMVSDEVKYAEKKVMEIESQIQNYREQVLKEARWRKDSFMHIPITERIIGKFKVTLPELV